MEAKREKEEEERDSLDLKGRNNENDLIFEENGLAEDKILLPKKDFEETKEEGGE